MLSLLFGKHFYLSVIGDDEAPGEIFETFDFNAGDNCFTHLLNADELLFGKNADREVEICDDSFDTFLVLFVMEWLNSKLVSLCFLTLYVELSFEVSSLYTSFVLFPIPVLLQFLPSSSCF